MLKKQKIQDKLFFVLDLLLIKYKRDAGGGALQINRDGEAENTRQAGNPH